MEQRTIEWYKARLGHITSSMVYNIMGTPRKKGETFTDTAKSYLYGIAAERMMADEYKGDKFGEWLERTDTTTRAMRWGTDNEDMARMLYSLNIDGSLSVKEHGFTEYIEGLYGDSPDGLVVTTDNAPKVVGVLEIKCPNSSTFVKYRHLLAEGKTLKEVEEKYYWQVQSHMMCQQCDWCDFVIYDKMMADPLYITRIPRNNDDIQALQERIIAARDFLNNLTATHEDKTE